MVWAGTCVTERSLLRLERWSSVLSVAVERHPDQKLIQIIVPVQSVIEGGALRQELESRPAMLIHTAINSDQGTQPKKEGRDPRGAAS